MISLGARFADYGLTGGFAICGQVGLLLWLAPDRAHSIIADVPRVLGTYLGGLPEGLSTPVSAVITAVGIISIFFLGLFLELIGSIAVSLEIRVFRKHLQRHRLWLPGALARYRSAVEDDFELVASEFGWKGVFPLLKPFSRAQALLLSHVLAADSAPRLELLWDQMQLCRVSRAVSATLFIFGCEILIAYFTGQVSMPSWGFGFGAAILVYGWYKLTVFLPVRAYERFCDSLFALVLVLSRKLDDDSKKGPEPRPAYDSAVAGSGEDSSL